MPNLFEVTGTTNPLNGFSQPGFGSQPVLVDLDRDGDLDLVIGGSPGTFGFFRNIGTATAPAYVAMTGADNPFNGIDVGAISSPAFGNLDDAGELDMVVGGLSSGAVGPPNPLQFFQNTGAGYSAVVHPLNSIDVGRHSAPTLGDLNGDGLLDLIVGSENGFLRYYQNTGTSSAASFTELTGTDNPFNGVDFGVNSSPRLFDYDRDGDLDLIVGNLDLFGVPTSSTLAYYRNDGPPSAPVFVARNGSSNPFAGITVNTASAVGLGDIDGDGDTDLVLPTREGGVRLLLQNRDPVAVVDTFSTDEDTAISRNVLVANPDTPDSDPDGDSLTIIEVNGSSALVGVPFAGAFELGSLTIEADGTFTFDPNGDFDGLTATGGSFQIINYTLSDGRGGRTVGRIDLTVSGLNDVPTTSPVTLDPINEDSPALTITQAMLLREAGDRDALAVLTATDLTQTGGNGTLTPLGGGEWGYMPAANDDTEVSFSYTISDGTATVAGSAALDLLPVNDAPSHTVPGSISVTEDVATALTGISVDDVDAGSGTLTMTLSVPAGTLTASAGGGVTVAGSGTGSVTLGGTVANLNNFLSAGGVAYTTAPNANGSVTLTVLTNDNGRTGSDGALSDTDTVTLDITPVNDAPPVAMPDSAQTRVNTAVNIAVLVNDSDIDGSPLSVAAVGQGGNGSVAIGLNLQSVTYTPNPAFAGFDNFSYTVSDGQGGFTSANVRVLVVSRLGGAGNDSLQGTSALDYLLGLGGRDTLRGLGGNDTIDGGNGNDTLYGGEGNDDLRGSQGNDVVYGDAGADTIYGGAGNDWLYGGPAGPGDGTADTFVFNTALDPVNNVDWILNFEANGLDRIALDSSIFTSVATQGTPGLDVGEFASVFGGVALDANDFIVFDPTDGKLYYDADGAGPAGRVQFARVSLFAGVVDASDFVVGAFPG